MKVLIAGGGTGGHVYPGIAVARTIIKRYPDAAVQFVGTTRGIEVDLVPRAGFKLDVLPVLPFPRRLSLSLLKAGLTAVRSLGTAVSLVRSFGPDVVVGTGGYVSGPIVLAAGVLRIPTLVQEQNAYPGVTTRLLSRIASRVALGYEEAAAHLAGGARTVVTGNPIREEILLQDRHSGARRLGLDPSRNTVLVFGASQGARSINRSMCEALPRFWEHPELQVLFVTGAKGFDETANTVEGTYGVRPASERISPEGAANGVSAERTYRNVRLLPYLYDMPSALAASDLVISRAGAISLSEITARGLPAILVPYPYAAENHQEHNARVLERAGAAVVLLDSEVNGGILADTTLGLLGDSSRLASMAANSRRLGRPDAALRVTEMVLELAARKPNGRGQ